MSYLTVNGRLEFTRPVYWNKEYGSVAPMDMFLGIENDGHSPGVCEICCREGLNNAFIKASENVKRLAQIEISHDTVRKIVVKIGNQLSSMQHKVELCPGFTASDCTEGTLVTGADGVMVPLVTEEQKVKRRKTQAANRKKEKRKSTAKANRPLKGSQGPYKEFKVVAFYDKDKSHQYVVGTAGNHETAGRLMRKIGHKLEITKAQTKYSVSDGAEWIPKQYAKQLPMLDENILDFYHMREHITATSHALFGEGSKEAFDWKQAMVTCIKEHGSLVTLDRLNQTLKEIQGDKGREELVNLLKYIGKRIDMTDYPYFIEQGYDIGSGPTESFCKCLTMRLKGSGMRWDKQNAQAIMALASLYSSGLWDKYWKRTA